MRISFGKIKQHTVGEREQKAQAAGHLAEAEAWGIARQWMGPRGRVTPEIEEIVFVLQTGCE